MAFHWQDNLHSTTFTPRDFQVELLAAAAEKNIIVCLGHNSSKEFIALKLILEKSHELRRGRDDVNRKITLYITSGSCGGESTYNLVFHLTDLKVINLNVKALGELDWERCFDDFQVIILNVDLCLDALICSYLDLSRVNLIVIEDCHMRCASNAQIDRLSAYVNDSVRKPRILGLAGALHNAGCKPEHLSFHLKQLEQQMQCTAETASDIVTVLRLVLVYSTVKICRYQLISLCFFFQILFET